jgi:hypothetical protein
MTTNDVSKVFKIITALCYTVTECSRRNTADETVIATIVQAYFSALTVERAYLSDVISCVHSIREMIKAFSDFEKDRNRRVYDY